ncbi:uncharacterized protein LY89DRAFT_690522 [Mollisia scopiformis]|uniref:Thioredoxin-like protein n=1 Tax=Mollisia scopiformis TaxID=149040 RepID=A0A132B973_MOLSC|nr:uncharacterized protein LY89DRAFT_690522 [Mollisia scopiformis]KUJ08952.1 hypothetical protein LY89DRAFT_690522 [Mollisia scopiformis]
MHFATVAKGLVLTKSHSHTHSDSTPADSTPPSAPEPVPHKINKITTLPEFEQILTDHHHRRVIIFCVTTTYRDPDVDEEGWYHHYEKLNDVHFVRVDLDESEELEERLKPRVRPCWFSFHKGQETGWSSGGMKRFLQMHSERKGSH